MSCGSGTEALAALGPQASRESARRSLTELFEAAGLGSAGLDARVLTCAALGIDHAELVREPDRPLAEGAATLRGFALRRLSREPVSRIIGAREFFGFRLTIDRHVLDPRPDTETLVEAVVARLEGKLERPLRILDLGTGSGAILCGLLASLPNAFGVGVDLSAGACAVARRNLVLMGFSARAGIVCGHWCDSLCGRFDVIVSNPPYIPSAAIVSLDEEVRWHDPLLALDGGADGLDAYRAIVPRLAARLVEDGLMAFEVGAEQSAEVAAILCTAGFEPAEPVRDLAGRARVVSARFAAATPPVRRAVGAGDRDEMPHSGSVTAGAVHVTASASAENAVGDAVTKVPRRSRPGEYFRKRPWRSGRKNIGSFARDHLFAPDEKLWQASRSSHSCDGVRERRDVVISASGEARQIRDEARCTGEKTGNPA